MKFIDVAKTFDQLEQEASRLRITELLADLFRKCSPTQAEQIAYLAMGDLNPPYKGTNYQFAEKSMIKVIARLIGASQKEAQQLRDSLGDAGLVIQAHYKYDPTEDLSLHEVDKALRRLVSITGEGSQESKEDYLYNVLTMLDPLSAKYVVRTIIGKLRLGFSDMTLLDAFSWMARGDKSLRPMLEDAYNVCVDIGALIRVLKEEGEEGVKRVTIVPGIPIRPAAAERLPDAQAIIEKIGKCVAQPKLDGFRLQVHVQVTGNEVEVDFFSRNLIDMSAMFPDLKEAVVHLPVKSIIAEGEAISYDAETGSFLPFQETVKRKRKHDIEKVSQDFPLKLYLFDLLYCDGVSFLDVPHELRRKRLKELVSHVSNEQLATIMMIEEEKINDAHHLEAYFNQTVSIGLEGLVVKRPDAIYQPGKRNFNWIKLKRQESGSLEDTIDCVILGYYAGHGKRAQFGIGALLVGVYNKQKDCFQTVAKIGTGLSDEEWNSIKKECDSLRVGSRPHNVECVEQLYPLVWVQPQLVCIIRADEITRSPLHQAGSQRDVLGLALRFPRIMGMRPDKNAFDATSVYELEELFAMQFKKAKRL